MKIIKQHKKTLYNVANSSTTFMEIRIFSLLKTRKLFCQIKAHMFFFVSTPGFTRLLQFMSLVDSSMMEITNASLSVRISRPSRIDLVFTCNINQKQVLVEV